MLTNPGEQGVSLTILPGSCYFTDKSVLLAGAGCVEGAALARAYAARGARVIAIDRDEARVIEIAAGNPSLIEPLKLDVMREAQYRLLGGIWLDEPIAVLVHLQPLRDPRRAGAAVQAIPALTRQLQAGLEAGAGQVLMLFRGAAPEAAAEDRTFATALAHLAVNLNADMYGAGLEVNAINIAPGCDGAECERLIERAALFLTGPGARGAGGTVLPVSPRSD